MTPDPLGPPAAHTEPDRRDRGDRAAPRTEAAPYCPCGGRCHHDTHPCSLGCWAAQKPWRVEEALVAGKGEAAAPALDPLTNALWRAMKELGWRVKGSDGMTDLPPNLVASELVARLTPPGDRDPRYLHALDDDEDPILLEYAPGQTTDPKVWVRPGDRDRREARLAEALQQDANLIHYGRYTKRPEDHSERFETSTGEPGTTPTRRTARTPLPVERPPMSEADLMRAVTDLAELYNWEWAHFRPAQTQRGWRTPVSGPLGKGFPDLVLARVRDRRLLFVELKAAKAKPTPEQDHVHAVLGAAAQTFLWRPWHLDSGEIQAVLR